MNEDKTKIVYNNISNDYCSSCGTEILKDANFCSKCGKNVNENMDEILAKIERNSKKIKRIKYLKNIIKGICITSVPFLLSFGAEFALENIILNKKETVMDSISKNEYTEVNSTEDVTKIETPFKPSDIKVEIIKVEEEGFTEGQCLLEGRITNNSNIPLKDMFINLSFDDGETSGYIGGDSVTVMPGKSYVTSGSASNIRNIDSVEVLSGNASWLREDNILLYTEIDFLMDITNSYITD